MARVAKALQVFEFISAALRLRHDVVGVGLTLADAPTAASLARPRIPD